MRRTFYDIETYPDYFLLVAQEDSWDYDRFDELENPTGTQLINFIANRNLVGFFNHGFDDVVISTILNRLQASYVPLDQKINPLWVYEIAQELIEGETDRFFGGLQQTTEDVMKYRGGRTNDLNLKGFENILLMPIVETPYDFNKPLVTRYKKKKVNYYCRNDVVATRKSFEYEDKNGSVDAVQTLRKFIAQKLDIPEERLVKSGTNSMMIKLLQNPTYDRSNFFKYIDKCNFEYAFSDPDFMKWYKKIIHYADDKLKLDDPILEFERNGFNWKFAKGGGHGHSLMTMFQKVFGRDFASLYPWILINICGLGEHCTALYREIVETRIKAKKSKNKVLAEGLKLAVNSLYGLTRSINNGAQLYNKYLGLDICIAGQVILYDLALRYEAAGATLVNGNTDGLLYVTNGHDDEINAISEEFAKRVNIELDLEEYPYYFAEHVNSYFVFDSYGNDVKRKGTFANVKPYSNNWASPNYVINYFKSETLGTPMDSWESIFENTPTDFILRAKNTKDLEFNFGITIPLERYGKNGRRLKDGEDFLPIQAIGKQFRGFATKDGYALRNYNFKTGKYVENGALKTGKIKSNYSLECDDFENINLDYYSIQADAIIQQISSNRVSKE